MSYEPTEAGFRIRPVLLDLANAQIFRNNAFQLLPGFPFLHLADRPENQHNVFLFLFSGGRIGNVAAVVAVDQAALFGEPSLSAGCCRTVRMGRCKTSGKVKLVRDSGCTRPRTAGCKGISSHRGDAQMHGCG